MSSVSRTRSTSSFPLARPWMTSGSRIVSNTVKRGLRGLIGILKDELSLPSEIPKLISPVRGDVFSEEPDLTGRWRVELERGQPCGRFFHSRSHRRFPAPLLRPGSKLTSSTARTTGGVPGDRISDSLRPRRGKYFFNPRTCKMSAVMSISPSRPSRASPRFYPAPQHPGTPRPFRENGRRLGDSAQRRIAVDP